MRANEGEWNKWKCVAPTLSNMGQGHESDNGKKENEEQIGPRMND